MGNYPSERIRLYSGEIRFDTKTDTETDRTIESDNSMIITGSGDVGIGTTAPESALHVEGDVRSSRTFRAGGGLGQGLYWNDHSNGLINVKGLPGGSYASSKGTVTTFNGNGNDGYNGYSIEGDYAFVADNSGCGIFNDITDVWMVRCEKFGGTSLYSNGNERFKTTSDGAEVLGNGILKANEIRFDDTSGQIQKIVNVENEIRIHTDLSFSIYESDNNTEVFRFDANAVRFGIGTTAPDEALHVGGGGNAHVEGNVVCDSGIGVKLGDGVAPSYELHVNGDVYATGEITAMSDRRVKRDIRTIADATDIVERLRGCRYTRSDAKPGEEHRERVGLVAQEVREVLPEVVENRGDYLGVSYGPVVGVLVEALKASNGRVRDMEAKLEEQRKQMETFMDRLAALEAR